MTPLERKKLEAELAQVAAARVSQEYRILECEDQIERIRVQIEIQLKREEELKKQLLIT